MSRMSSWQFGYLDRLIAERVTDLVVLPTRLRDLDGPGASRLIEALEACPRKPSARPTSAPRNVNGAGPGVYDIGGDVFRLRVNQAGTAVYPERLVRGEGVARWVYAPEVARRIVPSQRITDPECLRVALAP